MAITFENVIPEYLEKDKVDSSEVWNNTFQFLKGERVQVVAPSGRGKTSLIHFCYGLRTDYSGSIKIGERAIKALEPEHLSEIRRDQVSIIFQDLRLFQDHSISENITIKQKLNPFAGAESIEAMAEHLGIATKLNQKAIHCSYGEQQRVAIIRALQQPFDFLIMDEPFSHLDDNNIGKALDLILSECEKRKAGILLADLEIVKSFPSQRILNL